MRVRVRVHRDFEFEVELVLNHIVDVPARALPLGEVLVDRGDLEPATRGRVKCRLVG